MKNILLSIIIVSYKNLEVLVDCLESINKFNDIGKQLEVIVVDNSPDNSYIYNTVYEKYKWVNIIKNENKGFGQGNNVGVRNSHGRFILFLNPDTILVEPIMKFTIDKFISDKNLALFGVKLVDKNLRPNLSFFFSYRFGIMYNQLIKLANKMNIFLSSKMFIAGADIFVRKNVFLNAGMFDENIFMYGEELDLTNRVKLCNKKYKIKYFKEKRIIHLEGKSTEMKLEALNERMKSSIYLAKKYNLNANKKIRAELRYAKLKALVYKAFNNSKYNNIVNSIDVYKKYINN